MSSEPTPAAGLRQIGKPTLRGLDAFPGGRRAQPRGAHRLSKKIKEAASTLECNRAFRGWLRPINSIEHGIQRAGAEYFYAMTTCTNCGQVISRHVDRCVACYTDVGAPNVREAALPEQESALTERVRVAEEQAMARGCGTALDELRLRLEGSHAVICRPWAVADSLLRNDRELMATFYDQVRQHSRLPEDNDFDRWRTVVDQTFFPHYFEKLRFAAVSTTGEGAPKYGGCAIVLKDRSIEERSTVFHENTFEFWDRRMQRRADEPPPGFRAVWNRRADLGVAKLADRLEAAMTALDLDALILRTYPDSKSDEFLEVQVYGTLHRGSVASVTGKKPKKAADRALIANLRQELRKLGIEVTLQ